MFNAPRPPMTSEGPGLSRPGPFSAIAQSELSCEGEFRLRTKMGRSQGHKAVTVTLKGRYSNHPPDKVVKV